MDRITHLVHKETETDKMHRMNNLLPLYLRFHASITKILVSIQSVRYICYKLYLIWLNIEPGYFDPN